MARRGPGMARGIPAKRREGHAVAGVPVQVAVRCYSDPAVYTVRPVSQSIVSASPKPTRTVAHPPARANASASDVAAATRRLYSVTSKSTKTAA